MTDFETRLHETLREGAERAATDPGLAGEARRRLRRRRQRTAGAITAFALVVAAPVGIALTQGDEPRTAPDQGTDIASDPPSVPSAGERAVTFRDVTAAVPDGWSTGCPRHTEEFAVWVAAESTLSTTPIYFCDGRSTYGIEFYAFDADRQYDGEGGREAMLSTSGSRPEGAWTGVVKGDLGTAVVSMPTQEEAQQVLDSIDLLDAGTPDANGCFVMRDDAEASIDNGSEGIAVCRYDLDGQLEFSDLLTPAESRVLWAAVAEMPLSDATADDCQPPWSRDTVLLDGGSYAATVTTGTDCQGITQLSGVARWVSPELRALIGVQW